MARVAIPKGQCRFCDAQYGRAAMVKHMTTCKKYVEKVEDGSKDNIVYELLITGGYAGRYWLVVEVLGNETLAGLDSFLRQIWVESSWHMSEFEIGGQSFVSQLSRFSSYDDRDMNVSLASVLAPGMTFRYRYDFGDTTELKIEVKSERRGGIGVKGSVPGKGSIGNGVRLLARNEVTEVCDVCGKERPAWIDLDAYYSDVPAFWCRECFVKSLEEEDPDFDPDEDDLEDFIPDTFREFCNSPRMGVCGYEGSSYYGDD